MTASMTASNLSKLGGLKAMATIRDLANESAIDFYDAAIGLGFDDSDADSIDAYLTWRANH